jgi:hypothetical protein
MINSDSITVKRWLSQRCLGYQRFHLTNEQVYEARAIMADGIERTVWFLQPAPIWQNGMYWSFPIGPILLEKPRVDVEYR